MIPLKSKQTNLQNPFHFIQLQTTSLHSIKNPSVIVSDNENRHIEPVFLNVYDLLDEHRLVNGILKCCTCYYLGAYHTSIQMYGVEYYYGNGICKSRPYSQLGRLILSKEIGMTDMTQDDIEGKILSDMHEKFTREDCKRYFMLNYETLVYILDDLLRHNCNHFTDVFLYRLLGVRLPIQFKRTERCLIGTPCCIRMLTGMLGNDWTRPITEITSRSNRNSASCCLRATKRSLRKL